MRVARLSMDLLRPVPVAPIAVRCEVVREGRSIQVLAIDLFAADKLVARATALRIRAEDNADAVVGEPVALPGPEEAAPVDRARRLNAGFMTALDLRMAAGDWHDLGPAAVWCRFLAPIVAGEEASPVMRAAAIADTSSGLSATLPFDRFTFINADLTVSFARAPAGDWILAEARTWIGPDGAGLTRSRLADRQGYFGASTQSLVVQRR